MLVQPLAPDEGTSAQMPSVAASVLLHRPPQHSVSFTHASPIPVQNDAALLQVFVPSPSESSQNFEQHSAWPLHVLPAVLQLGLSGAHWPLLQMPEQHSLSSSHDWLSDVH